MSRYHMVLTSLPWMPTHFDEVRLPISRPRLEQRLKMLPGPDRYVLKQLAQALQWEFQPHHRSDEEVFAAYDRLQGMLESPLARDLVHFLMMLRRIDAAFRRRRQSMPPLEDDSDLGRHLSRHYEAPCFRLERRWPWVARMHHHLEGGKVMAYYRAQVQVEWEHYSALAQGYTFSFEALILYLARWELLHRWVSRDRPRGEARLSELVTEGVGSYGEF